MHQASSSLIAGFAANGKLHFCLVIKYCLELIRIMYRIRGLKDLISFKNEECTCLGSTLPREEKFLTKKNTFNYAMPPINNPNKTANQEHCFFKNGLKRSLKKPFSQIFHHKPTDRTINVNSDSSKARPLDSTGRQTRSRELLRSQSSLGNFNHKTYALHQKPLGQYYSANTHHFPNILNRQQLSQTSYKTLQSYIPAHTPPIIIVHLIQSPRFIKINYNNPSSDISTQKDEQQNSSPDSFKAFDRSLSTQNLGTKLDGFIDEKKEKGQLRKCESLKVLQKDFPVILEISENEAEQNMEIKETNDRIKLKKMDEVDQIYSQIDSDDESDCSNAQSIVLGRLNEYSSTMCNEISQISTIQRSSSQGKLIRLNSLMTTFDFERKQLQRTSSQLLSY